MPETTNKQKNKQKSIKGSGGGGTEDETESKMHADGGGVRSHFISSREYSLHIQ